MDKTFFSLLEIAKTKNLFDQERNFTGMPAKYLEGIRDEIDEVQEELNSGRQCYLEDELGDILWNYLVLLFSLEKEDKISLEKVFERACFKYGQRVVGIKNGMSWDDIKKLQKQRLADEFLSVE